MDQTGLHISLRSGGGFTAQAGQSILDAATASSIVFPYSCKTGRCSSCKCKVLEGRTTSLREESGLSEQERSEGWILSCVRSAQTDLVLDVEDFGGVVFPQPRTVPCKVSELELLAPDVIRVRLRWPPTIDFRYLPGQYVDIIGPGGVRRSYSIANAAGGERWLELHIRAVDGGAMSAYWFQRAKVDDLLRLNGPLGTFFLRDSRDVDLIFLATGTGMAPVKAMLESLRALPPQQLPRSVTVLWGGRRSTDLYLDGAALSAPGRFVGVLSRAGDEWTGARGYVQDVLIAAGQPLTHAAVYACGSAAMIHDAKAALFGAGLPAQRFYSDAFVCSATEP